MPNLVTLFIGLINLSLASKTYSKVGWVGAVVPGHACAVGRSSGNNGAVLPRMLLTAALTTEPMARDKAVDDEGKEGDKDLAEIGW